MKGIISNNSYPISKSKNKNHHTYKIPCQNMLQCSELTPAHIRAFWEIQCKEFSWGLMRDSSSGCGRQNREAGWRLSPAGRSVIRLT